VIDKQVKTTADAVAGVRDGSTVLVADLAPSVSRIICSTPFTNRVPGS
jgi:hypothetical protein